VPRKKNTPPAEAVAVQGSALEGEEKTGVASGTRIHEALRTDMAATIAAHAGCEVLFLCDLDEKGRVVALSDRAHGSRGMVPVLNHGLAAGQVIIHNHPSGRLVPSDADVMVAARLTDQGVGSWIVDNEVRRIYVITEAARPQQKEKLDPEKLAAVLGPNGAFSIGMPGFKPRSGQLSMLKAVTRAFNEDRVLAVEAGTGVGKSFAYLVPALAWAVTNKERIVVSTATINLQQQLVQKDIPAVARLLGIPVKAVLAKGRGNYLCLKRMGEALDEAGLMIEEEPELAQIRDWSEKSPDGSKTDLPFIPEDSLWSRVNADADSCPGLRCPLRDDCFFFKARREAASADIVVANHHLVLADAAMRVVGLGYESTVVLPAFGRLIFDEAHNVEPAATSYFSDTLNRLVVLKYLNLLVRRRKGFAFGLLPVLEGLGIGRVADVEPTLQRIRDASYRFDAEGLLLLGDESSLRLLPAQKERLIPFLDAILELQSSLSALVSFLKVLLEKLDEPEPPPSLQELDLITKRIGTLHAACDTFRVFGNDPDRVWYIERQRTGSGEHYIVATASPLDVGDRLLDAVITPYQTVVLTSATLTVRGDFRFILRRMGIYTEPLPKATPAFLEDGAAQVDPRDASDAEAVELSAPDLESAVLTLRAASPFDYANRVLLGVAQDAPEPSSPEFGSWLAAFVAQVLLSSGGHALVLFTSYDLLKRCFEVAQDELEAEGIPLYRQGMEERSRLLSRFNSESRSCLFATDSFWEGVDSPGDTLQVLIITKLPFRVPSEPLALARAERIEARGGKPFFELSLPEAVMKFRQGFGRLMRREDDFGVVLVSDSRIVSKGYGRAFLDSLPRTARRLLPAKTLLERSLQFLAQFRTDPPDSGE